jgi:antitoxin HicB
MRAADYRIEIVPLSVEDGGGYLAWVPDLPGCSSEGDNPAEAAANVQAAITEWIEEATKLGQRIPRPSRAVATV